MIASVIVFGSIAFGVLFVLAWLVRPDVRAWLESPKLRFQERVDEYNRRATGSDWIHHD